MNNLFTRLAARQLGRPAAVMPTKAELPAAEVTADDASPPALLVEEVEVEAPVARSVAETSGSKSEPAQSPPQAPLAAPQPQRQTPLSIAAIPESKAERVAPLPELREELSDEMDSVVLAASQKVAPAKPVAELRLASRAEPESKPERRAPISRALEQNEWADSVHPDPFALSERSESKGQISAAGPSTLPTAFGRVAPPLRGSAQDERVVDLHDFSQPAQHELSMPTRRDESGKVKAQADPLAADDTAVLRAVKPSPTAAPLAPATLISSKPAAARPPQNLAPRQREHNEPQEVSSSQSDNREPAPPPPPAPPPQISVRIGRIEVRGRPEPAPSPRPALLRPPVSLDDFLNRSPGGSR